MDNSSHSHPDPITLKLGKNQNSIGNTFQIHLDRIQRPEHPSYLTKITPLNFSSDMPLAYEMKYTFHNVSQLSRVGLWLQSEDEGSLAALWHLRPIDNDGAQEIEGHFHDKNLLGASKSRIRGRL